MERLAYHDFLKKLPILNPTPEEMTQLCPHLTAQQAVAAFNSSPGYVPCPPLSVAGAYQVIAYYKGCQEQGRPPQLSWGYAGRFISSYTNEQRQCDTEHNPHYADEAAAYASTHWGDQLCVDDWEDVVKLYISDPTELVEGKYQTAPKIKAVLFVALRSKWSHIFGGQKLPSLSFDDAIAHITLDPFIGAELHGGRGGYTQHNCAHCGGGLSPNDCTSCGHQFPPVTNAQWLGYAAPLQSSYLSARKRPHIRNRPGSCLAERA